MNRAKVWLIIRREYLESVRKKSFLFGLVATPLIFVTVMFVPILATGLLADGEVQLSVVDETGVYGEKLRAALEGGEAGTAGFRPTVTVWSAGEGPEAAELDDAVARGELSGWIRLPADFEQTGALELHAQSVLDLAALEAIENRATSILSEKKAADLGLESEQVRQLLQRADLKVFRAGDAAKETDPEQLYLRAVILVMMLFFALLPTGQILMRSVIEEKANRVVEVLVSSVTPREIMVGKILGLGAVGLTLIGAWAAAGGLLAWRSGSATLPVGGGEIGIFLLYFFPGYFLYAALLGAIGSVCSSERDAQPFLTPISLLLVLPVMAGFAIAQNPDHLAARVLSFVPLVTPSLMVFRYTIQPPPAWEIAATWLVLVASTVGMFWISARVFRTGILMIGKRPTLPEIARWVWAR
ncbi:MAG: ABC transporter permease [Candidatus Eiseniibacteriota bacterium]